MTNELVRRKVLITGPAGRVGQGIRPFLRDRYTLRLMCHRTSLEPESDEEVVAGDVLDIESVRPAMKNIDAVVHLAGDPSMSASWESVRDLNIQGTYNVYEAAREAGVKKIVFASTNHVTGWWELEGTYTTPEMPIRPDTYYGVSKAFGEALSRYYVDAFGMSIICLRIGSFLPQPTNPRSLSTWLSPRDCAQLVWRSIERDVPFGIFYGISANTRRYWDYSNAQELLGYAPEDDGERFAAEILGS